MSFGLSALEESSGNPLGFVGDQESFGVMFAKMGEKWIFGGYPV